MHRQRGLSRVTPEKRKIYVALPDRAADKHDLVRIVDECGDDYLYAKSFFREISARQAG